MVQSLLKPLVDTRLLTTGSDEQGQRIVELSHEALIPAWQTLRGWIEGDREDLRFQIQFEAASCEWDASARSDDFLWSGLRLANAEAWVARAQPRLNARDQAFLEASRAARERSTRATAARRLRRLTRFLIDGRRFQRNTLSC